jgi:hypothetical protein
MPSYTSSIALRFSEFLSMVLIPNYFNLVDITGTNILSNVSTTSVIVGDGNLFA